MAEYKILQEQGVDIFPITHPDAVRDENGKSVTEMIAEVSTQGYVEEVTLTEDVATLEIELPNTAKAEVYVEIELKAASAAQTFNMRGWVGKTDTGVYAVANGIRTSVSFLRFELRAIADNIWVDYKSAAASNSALSSAALNGLPKSVSTNGAITKLSFVATGGVVLIPNGSKFKVTYR